MFPPFVGQSPTGSSVSCLAVNAVESAAFPLAANRIILIKKSNRCIVVQLPHRTRYANKLNVKGRNRCGRRSGAGLGVGAIGDKRKGERTGPNNRWIFAPSF